MSRAVTNGADAPFWITGCKLTAGFTGNYSATFDTQTINDGKWHYVAAIWEDATLTLYNDGRRVGTPFNAAPPISGAVSIGSHAGSNYFVGDIDNPFVASE
jgi:hypothetical protein